ncbi:MAG: SusD/RagB family nutrient-binding outer membrane lipoprotein, partial [Saprospiraceae bacterium]
MYKFKKYLLLLFTITVIASCSEELSDLNIDPNNSPNANPAQVLSSAQGFLGWTVDGQFNVRSALWAQYWTWGPGVAIGNIERYVSDGTDYDNGWTRLYNGALADLDFIENSDAKVHAGIAKIMKAYIFQSLVDHFGDIPFSEALKGASDGNFAPKYDDDQEVYNALIPMINDGIKLLGTAGSISVGAEDYIYGGNVGKWTKFANSLKLRILMRQSNVKDVSAEVKALVSAGNFIESSADMAAMPFTGVSGSENPMYASFERSLGLFYVASNSTLNLLQDLNDPRIGKFYNPATATSTFVGIHQGS